MSEDPQQTKSPDEIRADIEHTREELGDTVEALGAKSDVKGRAQAKVEDVKSQAKAKVGEVKDKVTPSGGSDSGASSEGDQGAPAAAAAKAQEGGQKAAEAVKANPLPYAVAAALLLGILIGRRGRSS